MKIKSFALLTVFILVLCGSAFADDWDKYSQYMDRFYFLDKQKPFKKISCRIKLSSLDAIDKQLSTITKSSDAIKYTEDFDNFSITMDKDRNFSFTKPTLDVELVSEENVKDPEKVKTGIEYIKSGFQQQIEGTISVLEELLKNVYFSPRKDEYSKLVFTEDKKSGSVKVTYKKDDVDVLELYKDTMITQTETSANQKADAKISFQKLNGKLVMKKADIKVLQGSSEIYTAFLVDYQKAGSIILPAKINAKVRTSVPDQNIKFDAEFYIGLTDCKVE